MNDFISRESAVKAITEYKVKIESENMPEITKCCFQMLNITCDKNIGFINSIPAADVQPVKRGRWFLRGGNWCCSACNRKTLLTLESNIGGCKEYGTAKTDYCPNCGAKMESEDK